MKETTNSRSGKCDEERECYIFDHGLLLFFLCSEKLKLKIREFQDTNNILRCTF